MPWPKTLAPTNEGIRRDSSGKKPWEEKKFAMNSVCHLDVWIINFINERKICESRRKYACVCKGVIVLLFILFYFIFCDRDYSSV